MGSPLGRILAGFAVLLSAGVSAPRPAYGSAPGPGLPSGSDVLRQAATAMQRFLHTVHTEGWVQMRAARKMAQSRISGNCVMTSRSQSDNFQSRGTTIVNGQLRSSNVNYISVRSHTWRRTETGKWQRADADQGALMSLNLCPAFFLFQPGMANIVPTARSGGTVAVSGRKTWHVTLHSAFLKMDVYVDRQTHFWLRMVSTVPGPPLQYAIFNYSAFNHAVSITPPR